MAGALQLDKELHRLVAPHLTLLRRDVRSIYPELNAELTLLQWLCERNGLKPPQPAYPKDEDAVAPPSSPTPTVPPRRTKIPSLPPVSSRSASSSTSAALGAGDFQATYSAYGALTARPPQRSAFATHRAVTDGNSGFAGDPGAFVDGVERNEAGMKTLGQLMNIVQQDAEHHGQKIPFLRETDLQMRTLVADVRQDLRGKFLANVPIFMTGILSAEDQFRLVGEVRPYNFASGDTIVEEGHLGERLFIIEQGICEICRKEGDTEVHIANIGRGHFFGELAVIYSSPRAATVRAKTKVTLLTLSQADLRRTIGEEKMQSMCIYACSRYFANIPALSTLTTRHKLRVTEQLRTDVWSPGSVLSRQDALVEGDTRRMYIIQTGECVEETRKDRVEGSEKEVRKLKSGAFFGMLAMFYGNPRKSTVTATTSVTTLSLSHDVLRGVCRNDREGKKIWAAATKSMRFHLLQISDALGSHYSDDELALILEHTRPVLYKKWDRLMAPGDLLTTVYVLEEGALAEHHGQVEDLQLTPVESLLHSTPGVTFGAQCILDRNAVGRTSLAASVDSSVLCIPAIVLRSVRGEKDIDDGGYRTPSSRFDPKE